MKLLYLCSDFGIPPQGTKGASIHVRAITRALRELGHEVRFLSPKGGPGDDHPAKPVLPSGCPSVDATARQLKRWLLGHGLSDAAARELRPLLFNAWMGERISEHLAGDPPDAVIERLSLFGHVGLDIAELLNVPLIVEVNAPLANEAAAFRSLALRSLAAEIEERVLRGASAVTAVSTPLADHLAAAGVQRERIHVVQNGVHQDHYRTMPSREVCRTELGLNGAFVVGFVGSLKPWHGVDLLIEAFAQVAQKDASARLLIVGEGKGEADLQRQVARLGLESSVRFHGAVPHDRVPELLAAMDVAVAPFRPMDNFYFSPIKLFEYMAAGTCVVASSLGQIAEVVDDGVNGLLFRPDDLGHLIARIEEARGSSDLRTRLGAAARRIALDRFTWSHAARATAAVVQAAVQAHPSDVRKASGCQSGSGGRATRGAARNSAGEEDTINAAVS